MDNIDLDEIRLVKAKVLKALNYLYISTNSTVSEIARKCDIPTATMKKYIYGEKTPSINNIVKILNSYELSFEEFINRNYSKNKKFKQIVISKSYISNKIKSILDNSKLNLLQFASNIYISYSTLNRYLKGEFLPRLWTIMIIMEQYNYTFEELISS